MERCLGRCKPDFLPVWVVLGGISLQRVSFRILENLMFDFVSACLSLEFGHFGYFRGKCGFGEFGGKLGYLGLV